MATKIKRCLYIGLGGTGINALLHTKKMFIDTYGEVPPMIGFLGIDTDSGAYKKTLKSVTGDDIALQPNEQLPILVHDARPIYDVNKEYFSWIPEQNLYALTSMTLGAGQVRTNGRFAFTTNYVSVSHKVSSIIDNITNAHIMDNEKYGLLSANTEIHVVFSICGGTGCGTFLNMAYLLHEVAPQCKLTGYAVLPDIFKSMMNSGVAKVAPNAYGAIMDLDYLMHMGMDSAPVSLAYIKENYDIRERPFNSVVFIDNKNNNLDTYTHIDELTEMISLALVTSAGELSSAAASVSDNLEKNITEGSMDIENKKAWAAGMGVCEILYRGAEISQIYAIKAAKNLIERMYNSCADTDAIANAWIDSSEVNIRENNNNDHVIDFIADKNPQYDLTTINDCANPDPEVEQNLAMNKIQDKDVKEKVDELTTRVRRELRKLLIEHINKEGGLSTAKNIINSIVAQINIYLGEMEDEKKKLVHEEPIRKTSVETAVSDLKTYDGRFFKSKNKQDDLVNDLEEAVRQLNICRREITRRVGAITVFNNINIMLSNARTEVENIGNMLEGIQTRLTTELGKLQNNIGKTSQTFQIDLDQDVAMKISVEPNDVVFSDFVKGLTPSDKIYGFTGYSMGEIYDMIMVYTSNLHTAKEMRGTTIDNVIDKLDKEDFDRMVDLAIKKSMPLFRYDYRGYTPQEQPHDAFYIGVPDKANNRLFKDGFFKCKVEGNSDVDFADIGMNDRIIIYHQFGVVPAYAIASINNYRREYEDCNVSTHFDDNLLKRMDREEFSLMPKRNSDDDLLDLWVKGFIFGLVRNNGGTYEFKSREHGDALDDFWVELGKYRDDAFDQFRRYKSSVRKEFVEHLDNLEKSKGKDTIQEIINDVKTSYLDKYSQILMTKEQIKAKGYEKIRDLITRELNLVQKSL